MDDDEGETGARGQPVLTPGHYSIDGDGIVFSLDATDADMVIVGWRPGLKRIGFVVGVNRLVSARITSAGFLHLRGHAGLEVVELGAVPITDDALASITTLTALRELDGQRCEQITDRAFAGLAARTELRRLRLHAAPITDAGLACIQSLRELEDLQLGGARLSDASIVVISHFTKLHGLDLQQSAITDDGLAQFRFAKLTRLQHLNLSGTKITDGGLHHLAHLPALTRLALNRLPVTASGLRGLASSSLAELSLSDTHVTDDALVHLGRLGNLCFVDLDHCSITDRGLEILAGIESLKRVSLFETKVTAAGYARVRRARPDLELWNLSFQTQR